MVHRRFHRVADGGFGLIELIVVVAILGILAVLGMPMMISYWQAATISAAASELVTALNRARQIAISTNTPMCVEVTGTNIRYRQTTCAGTIWTGSGTDGNGIIQLANNVQVSTTANVIFTALGAASTAGTLTVTQPATGRTRAVVVAASGRVSVQ